MTIAAERIPHGVVTRRGIGVSRTVHCKVAAHFSNDFAGIGGFALEVPIPPAKRLRNSHGIYIKYFKEGDPGGNFNLVERQTSAAEAGTRGYLISGVPGPETRRQKRLKQVFLPLTTSVRIYTGRSIQVEPGCSLEYG